MELNLIHRLDFIHEGVPRCCAVRAQLLRSGEIENPLAGFDRQNPGKPRITLYEMYDDGINEAHLLDIRDCSNGFKELPEKTKQERVGASMLTAAMAQARRQFFPDTPLAQIQWWVKADRALFTIAVASGGWGDASEVICCIPSRVTITPGKVAARTMMSGNDARAHIRKWNDDATAGFPKLPDIKREQEYRTLRAYAKPSNSR